MPDVLYGAKGASETTSDLYTIDPVTGVATSVGPIGFALTGLALDPITGLLYGATSNNSGANPRSIIQIDIDTGAGSLVGAQGLSGSRNLIDICFDSTGQMYGMVGPNGTGTKNALATVNKTTGAVTLVGTGLGIGTIFGGGCDFDGSSVLWGLLKNANLNIYTANTGTGLASAGAVLNGSSNDTFPAASFTPDKLTFYAIIHFGSGPTGANRLCVINTSSGVITEIASLDDFFDALVWAAFSGFSLSISADPTTGPKPLTVDFTATAGATIATWDWDFGDGGSSSSQNPTHVYTDTGTFTVTLTATSDDDDVEVRTLDIIVTTSSTPTIPPCGTALDPQTFFGVPWRSLVTTLETSTVTFLDRLAHERTVKFGLNSPAQATGRVPSEDPEVNILATDGDPFVAQSDRLLYMFRREGTPTCWVCRFGGILMPMQDQAGSDNANSSYTAFDPWQLLYKRPVVLPPGDALPGPNGLTYKDVTADVVVDDLMTNMWVFETGLGNAHPEAFIDFGQTAFYTGTMETAHVVEWMNFSQTTSIGQAFDQLTQAGLCDIILEPVYDPFNRPGIVAQLSVYMLAGAHRNNAIMAWDKPSRSLVGVDALYDGGVLVNQTEYFPSQGPAVPLLNDAASIAKYGSYWELGMFTASNALLEISEVAQSEILLRRDGKSTYRVNPIAGRSPIPLLEYGLGDQLPVYASSRMRKEIAPTLSSGEWLQMSRVYGIEVTLDDNEMEAVSLTLSRDGDF